MSKPEKTLDEVVLTRLLRLNAKVQGLVTGTLFAAVLGPLVDSLNRQVGSRLTVTGVDNKYFGGDVSVAGLLTGGDLVAAREQIQGDFVIISKSTLKSDEEIMLDGMTLAELTVKLGLPVYAFDLKSFARFLLPRN